MQQRVQFVCCHMLNAQKCLRMFHKLLIIIDFTNIIREKICRRFLWPRNTGILILAISSSSNNRGLLSCFYVCVEAADSLVGIFLQKMIVTDLKLSFWLTFSCSRVTCHEWGERLLNNCPKHLKILGVITPTTLVMTISKVYVLRSLH